MSWSSKISIMFKPFQRRKAYHLKYYFIYHRQTEDFLESNDAGSLHVEIKHNRITVSKITHVTIWDAASSPGCSTT